MNKHLAITVSLFLLALGALALPQAPAASSGPVGVPRYHAPEFLTLVPFRERYETTTRNFKNTVGMDMVVIAAGTFMMGSPAGEFGREPFGQATEALHEVELTRSFYMSKYLVTQEAYEKVVGKNPSSFSPNGPNKGRVVGLDTRRFPVEMVNWKDGMDFCSKLTEMERSAGRLAGDMQYSLPSEAEWEYCCRAGTRTAFHFGETLTIDQANYNGQPYRPNDPAGQGRNRTTEVGSFPANAWGLHDMHGNVYQWVEDTYDANFYLNSPRQNPICTKGTQGIFRTGSYADQPRHCRSAFRHGFDRNSRMDLIGFRVVLRPVRPS